MVASSIPGVKDLIELSGRGIAVNPENLGELATIILGLMSDESTQIILGEKGRKYVVENHSWNGVARNILDICNNIIP
jgi:glycosyltransferase involved in cell wall biosynthesis